MHARTFAAAMIAAVAVAGPAWAGKSNDTLVWATDKEVNVPLPYYNNLRETVITTHHVWDALLYRNPDTFKYEPLLATSYKWIDDKTLEFELRQGVTFHDGSAFNADDVVDTLTHVSSKDSGVLTRTNVDWIASVEKLGDYKVRIHAKEPFPAALEYLAGPLAIMPDGIWKTAKTDATGKKDYGSVAPIGTGPYKMAEMVPSDHFLMVANDKYYDGPKPKAKIGKVLFRTIPDKETQLAELVTGGIDWIWDVPKDKAEQLEGMGAVTVVNADTMRISYIGMDAAKRGEPSPFNDIRVRKAVAHAIDREAIVKNLIGGASRVIHSACYPTQFGCTQDVPKYAYDPAAAKKLLAEAGYADGFTTDIYAYREREYTEAVIGYLKNVGIQANLKYMQYQALRGLVWDGKTPFYNMTWGSGSVNDVSAITSLFFNHGRDDYCRDDEVLANIKKGDTSVDEEVRKDAYRKALARIQELVCWLPMFTYSKYYAYSKDLAFRPTPDEIPEFYAASWK